MDETVSEEIWLVLCFEENYILNYGLPTDEQLQINLKQTIKKITMFSNILNVWEILWFYVICSELREAVILI